MQMDGAETATDRIKARHVRAILKKGAVVKQRDGTTVLSESLGAARSSKAVQRVADAMVALDSTKVCAPQCLYAPQFIID